MLDIIARLVLSAGIMIGTAYLPALSPLGRSEGAAGSTVEDLRTCASRPAAARVRACIV